MQKIITGRLVIVRLTLLAAVLALVAVGLATLYAVGCPAEASPAGSAQGLIIYWKKQLVYAAVGGLGFLAANVVNYRRFGAVGYSIYGIILLLLALLLVSRFIVPIPFIPMRNGAYRWIQLGDLPAIQPSELCKLAYILALAWYLRYRSNYRNF